MKKTSLLYAVGLVTLSLSGCSSFDWDGGRESPGSSYGFFDGAVNTQTYHGAHGNGGHKH